MTDANQQSKTELLAAQLDAVPETGADPELIEQAAAELRRLHTLNQELLEAIAGLVGCIDHGSENPTEKLDAARAAIAQATGKTK